MVPQESQVVPQGHQVIPGVATDHKTRHTEDLRLISNGFHDDTRE